MFRPAVLILALVTLFIEGTAISLASAQTAGFFRISGPTAAKLVSFQSDGTLIWSNAQAGSQYMIQTANFLTANWVDYLRTTASSGRDTNRLFACNTPAMSFIPGGEFTIGDVTDNNLNGDAPPTNVTISEFYMDVNLVTYSEWQAVYSYATNHGYAFDNIGSAQATNQPVQPVQKVNWYDCVKWCNARSQMAGLTPVYYTDGELYTNGENDAVYADWSANGFRLPTEAEWEKAARGGLTNQRFPWGDIISETNANYYSDTTTYPYDQGPDGYNAFGSIGGNPRTTPVGSFKPNHFGLYDMSGNVVEWCWDWYDTAYGQPTTNNPSGPGSGTERTLRGGGWDYYASAARCAARFSDSPSAVWNDYGFRCVRGL